MGDWDEVVEVERGTSRKQLGSSLKNSSETDSENKPETNSEPSSGSDSETVPKNKTRSKSKTRTANAEARRLAGITTTNRRKYLRDRRRNTAVLTIEVDKELKAELLKIAKDNGTSLKEEVTKRIVAYDPDS